MMPMPKPPVIIEKESTVKKSSINLSNQPKKLFVPPNLQNKKNFDPNKPQQDYYPEALSGEIKNVSRVPVPRPAFDADTNKSDFQQPKD